MEEKKTLALHCQRMHGFKIKEWDAGKCNESRNSQLL